MVPLNELIKDHIRRAQSFKIKNSVWLPGTFIPEPRGILFVSCDHAISKSFKAFVDAYKNNLLGIFIDEAHLIFTDSSYREALRLLPKQIEFFGVRTFLLSATFPPDLQDNLKTALPGVDFLVCRVPTSRPNIKISVDYRESIEQTISIESDIIRRVIQVCESEMKSMQELDRVIIYAPFKTMVSKIVTSLQRLKPTGIRATCLDGGMDDLTRDKAVEDWNSGCVMVSTSAFGAGIDYPKVRLVIVAGGAYSMLDLVQQIGRGGRDGLKASGRLITSLPFLENIRATLDDTGKQRFSKVVDFVKNGLKRCLIEMVGDVVDGKGFACALRQDCEFCGVCEARMRVPVCLPMGSLDHLDKRRRIEQDQGLTDSQQDTMMSQSRDSLSSLTPTSQELRIAASRPLQPPSLVTKLQSFKVKNWSLFSHSPFESLSHPTFQPDSRLFSQFIKVCEKIREFKFCWYCLGLGRLEHEPHLAFSRCPGLLNRCLRCCQSKHSGNCVDLGVEEIRYKNRLSSQTVDLKICVKCKVGKNVHQSCLFGECPQAAQYAIYFFVRGLYDRDQNHEFFAKVTKSILPSFKIQEVGTSPQSFFKWVISPSFFKMHDNSRVVYSLAPNGMILLLERFFNLFNE